MPYAATGKDVPDSVKKRFPSGGSRRQWAQVWNSVYRKTGDEGRAFASANSAVNKTVAEELLARIADAVTKKPRTAANPRKNTKTAAANNAGTLPRFFDPYTRPD